MSFDEAVQYVSEHTSSFVADNGGNLHSRVATDLYGSDKLTDAQKRNLTGEYLSQKHPNGKTGIKTHAGGAYSKVKNSSGVMQFAENSVLGNLDTIINSAGESGISVAHAFDPTSGIMKLGFYDRASMGVNPEDVTGLDWNAMATIDMPTLNEKGSLMWNGMELANFGMRELKANGDVTHVGAQEALWNAIRQAVTGYTYKDAKTGESKTVNPLRSLLANGNIEGARSYLRRVGNDIMQKSPAIGSSSVAQEIASYSENNGSPEQ